MGLAGAVLVHRVDSVDPIDPIDPIDRIDPPSPGVEPPPPPSPAPSSGAMSPAPSLVALAARGQIVLPAVVNVWLQSCRDCMPAFQAWRAHDEVGALAGIRVVNVSYGQPDAAFAAAWRVQDSLVVDATGDLMVRPFGISSFTTLVLDAEGREVHRDRPDRPGYAERVRAMWQRVEGEKGRRP